MIHRSDIPRVFWSREDWLAEIDELEAKLTNAGNDTATARFWNDPVERGPRRASEHRGLVEAESQSKRATGDP